MPKINVTMKKSINKSREVTHLIRASSMIKHHTTGLQSGRKATQVVQQENSMPLFLSLFTKSADAFLGRYELLRNSKYKLSAFVGRETQLRTKDLVTH